MKTKYQIVSIDAWGNQEEGYEWNDIRRIRELESDSTAKNVLRNVLKSLGFKVTSEFRYYFETDWLCELQERRTGKPLYAACVIPGEH